MIVVAVLYGLRQPADSADLATFLAICGAAVLVEIGIVLHGTGDKRAVFRLRPRRFQLEPRSYDAFVVV